MYVDGFVFPVPTKNLKSYQKIANLGAKIWMEHGALSYVECIGDDLNIKGVFTFPQLVKPKKGETIGFSFITYKSKAHRDSVNKKVMADPRMQKAPDPMPFDYKRMSYGGFKSIVNK